MAKSDEKIVVLVDDEIAYIDLLAQLLGEHLSCPVRGFTKPKEALSAIPTLNVGLIITDYQMPEMNGLVLIDSVQKINANIPVVMITGHPLRLTDREKADLPSLRALINKPFKWRALAEEISKHWRDANAPQVIAAGTPPVSTTPASHL